MIKFIVAALWILGVTIGTIFFSYSASGEKHDSVAESPFLGELEYMKTDMLSVPVVKGGEVVGYFLSRFVYAIEPEKLKKLSLPADTLLVDQLYTYLFSNPQIDFADPAGLDVAAMRTELRDSINERVGADLVHEVLIEQIDYLTKEQIRDNALRRRDSNGGDNRPVFKAH